MPKDLAQLLRNTIERELPNLQAVSQEPARSPRPGGWSAQEELGHLIDSAANNHIRFALASIEGEFRGRGYAQDAWVEAHGYRDLVWDDIVELWYRLNSLLVHVIGRMPESALHNWCVVDSTEMTLGFVIEDYVVHMQHHLDHILGREVVTPYPAATDRSPFVSG